jgi:hypothetical protein
MLWGTQRFSWGAGRAIAICGALVGGACTSSSSQTDARAQAAETDRTGTKAEPDEVDAEVDGEIDGERGAEIDLRTKTDASTTRDAEPREHRRATRAMMLYTEPSFGAPFRGKIPHGEVFGVYDGVQAEDPRCGGEGWARVGTAAFACLEHSSLTDEAVSDLPRLPKGRLVPYYYARLKPKRADGTNPPAPIWRSRASLREKRPPIGHLEPAHVYAFDRRKRMRGGAVLESRRGVVREADVKPLEPRDFEGRDLLAEPVPVGMTLAWTVTWPQTQVFAEPRSDAKVSDRLDYHVPILLAGPSAQHRGTELFPIVSPAQGWVDGSDIRRWIPMPPPEGVGADELWLDVELEQQTLTVMRGDRPELVTLVSTGTWKDPTPVGLFRIGTKEAYGDMRSRAGDDDTYHVEAVPWVQYFHNRYALHGAYWHNRFGRRTSHGCINLSPKDAARVFALTEPRLPPGWIMIYEHAEDQGTLVRIRKLTTPPPDKRTAPRERRASDYG